MPTIALNESQIKTLLDVLDQRIEECEEFLRKGPFIEPDDKAVTAENLKAVREIRKLIMALLRKFK